MLSRSHPITLREGPQVTSALAKSSGHDPYAPEFGECLERISGPYHGVYLAAHSARFERGFYGYAKLCPVKPKDVWNCTAIAKVSSTTLTGSPESALLLAEQRAREVLQMLAAEAEGSVPARFHL